MLCPNCHNPATQTDWQPGPGLDASLRQYQCTVCHLEFYSPRATKKQRSNRPKIEL